MIWISWSSHELIILESDWAELLSAAEQILHKLDPRPPVLTAGRATPS